jgi:hypothetical protein
MGPIIVQLDGLNVLPKKFNEFSNFDENINQRMAENQHPQGQPIFDIITTNIVNIDLGSHRTSFNIP